MFWRCCWWRCDLKIIGKFPVWNVPWVEWLAFWLLPELKSCKRWINFAPPCVKQTRVFLQTSNLSANASNTGRVRLSVFKPPVWILSEEEIYFSHLRWRTRECNQNTQMRLFYWWCELYLKVRPTSHEQAKKSAIHVHNNCTATFFENGKNILAPKYTTAIINIQNKCLFKITWDPPHHYSIIDAEAPITKPTLPRRQVGYTGEGGGVWSKFPSRIEFDLWMGCLGIDDFFWL